jgi:hypothetical protein
MGVELILKEKMTLVKTHDFKFEDVDFELNNTPDIANYCCHLSWSRYRLPPYRTPYVEN